MSPLSICCWRVRGGGGGGGLTGLLCCCCCTCTCKGSPMPKAAGAATLATSNHRQQPITCFRSGDFISTLQTSLLITSRAPNGTRCRMPSVSIFFESRPISFHSDCCHSVGRRGSCCRYRRPAPCQKV